MQSSRIIVEADFQNGHTIYIVEIFIGGEQKFYVWLDVGKHSQLLKKPVLFNKA